MGSGRCGGSRCRRDCGVRVVSAMNIAWLAFGAGLGSVAAMFLTAAFMLREFERREAERVRLRKRYIP